MNVVIDNNEFFNISSISSFCPAVARAVTVQTQSVAYCDAQRCFVSPSNNAATVQYSRVHLLFVTRSACSRFLLRVLAFSMLLLPCEV
jgi:hypothetical protein